MRKLLPWILAGGIAVAVLAQLLIFFAPTEFVVLIAGMVLEFAIAVSFIALIMVLWFFLRRKDEASKWTDGQVGVGTVRTYNHTGKYNGIRNYKISMLVEAEDGTLFDANLDSVVGRRALPSLEPGAKIPVCFSAANRSKVYVPHGPLIQRAQLMYDFVRQRDGMISQTALNARYWGMPCRATVQNSQFTQRRDGIAAEWLLGLMVFTPDGQQFPSTARVFLTQPQYELLKTKPYLEAKYSSDDRGEVAVKVPRK